MSALSTMETLEETGAVKKGSFVYSSGLYGDTYIDKFVLFGKPYVIEHEAGRIVEYFADYNIQTIVGPATGGAILAFEVARQMSVEMKMADKHPAGFFYIGRGISFNENTERTLVVDDVLTTGNSISQTIGAVERANGNVLGAAVLIDRRGGEITKYSKHGMFEMGPLDQNGDYTYIPFFACLNIDIPSYSKEEWDKLNS